LRMDDMNASLSRRKPLDVPAEPGCDLLETNIFNVAKSVRANHCCNAGRLEAAGPTFFSFLKLFGPLGYRSPDFFGECLGWFHVVEHHLRVLDGRHVVQSAADGVVCQIWHNAEPSEKRSGGALKAGATELLLQIIPLEIDGHEGKPWRRREF